MRIKNKILFVLCILLLIGCGINEKGEVNHSDGKTHSEDDANKVQMEYLNNTYYRLQVEKELKIAYFGGSVTDGYGASNPETNSWRALVTEWLKSQYKDADITTFNASIGGTGTQIGAYRAIRDLNLQNPENCADLIFIEYAINDMYEETEGGNSKLYLESILQTIYQYAPKTDVILVFVTDFARQDTMYSAVKNQMEVAERYRLPYIYIGSNMWNDIVKENNNTAPDSIENAVWKKYFIDIVHPTDEGYAKYATYVAEYLYDIFEKKDTTPTKLLDAYLPTQISKDLPTNPYLLEFSELSFESEGVVEKINGAIAGNTDGATISFMFTGTDLSLWVYATPDGGDLSVSIDGETNRVISLYRKTANHKVLPIAQGMSEGNHEVKITLHESFYGTTMDLRAILTNGVIDKK